MGSMDKEANNKQRGQNRRHRKDLGARHGVVSIPSTESTKSTKVHPSSNNKLSAMNKKLKNTPITQANNLLLQ